MKRHFAIGLLTLCLFAVGASAVQSAGVAPSSLVSEQAANAVGLTRAWFAQATVDVEREHATSATFQDGLLLITTDSGILQVFDGETGTALWTVNVGDGLLLEPAVNSKVVAAIAGTNLVIYDRFNGKKLDEVELFGDPSSGPVLSEREVYTPLVSQRIHAFPLEPAEEEASKVDATVTSMLEATDKLERARDEWATKLGKATDSSRFAIKPLKEIQPHSCASLGLSFVPPVIGTQSYPIDVVGWTTNEGWLLIGEMLRRGGDDPFKLFYKIQARPSFAYVNEERIGNRALIPRDDVTCSPFYLPTDESDQGVMTAASKKTVNKSYLPGGMFIVGSESGHVFALNDVSGDLRWTYLTLNPITERVSAFYKRPAEGEEEIPNDPCLCAYVPTDSGSLFAVSLRSGKEVWESKGIQRTIAASKTRLYTIDQIDRLAIIDRVDGKRLGSLKIGAPKFQVFNQENDRIYIVTSDGLIQCLRETQAETPLLWRESCSDVRNRLVGEYLADEKNLPKASGKAGVKVEAAVSQDKAEDKNVSTSSGTPDDDEFDEVDSKAASKTSSSSNSSSDEDDEEEDSTGYDDEEEDEF